MTTKKPGKKLGRMSWQAEPGRASEIRVQGRLRRADGKTVARALILTPELAEKLEAVGIYGNVNGAILGLLAFALDEVNARKISLTVTLE